MKQILNKIFFITLLSFTLFGCTIVKNDDSNIETNNQSQNENQEQDNIEQEEICTLCANLPTAEKVVHDELAAHIPTTFDVNTVEVTTTNWYDGIEQKAYTFQKGSYESKVVVTEVDLSKAHIAAGALFDASAKLAKSTPYSSAMKFENTHDRTSVVAAVNADFFGGTTPVNAFVKDSTIIKDSHNDNGIYDYKNLSADIPASMPMLFGVSGSTAQIAPIIQNASVKDTIQAKLFYELAFTNKENTTTLKEGVIFNDEEGSNSSINVLTNDECIGTALPGSKVLMIAKHKTDSTRLHGEIKSITEVLGNSIYRSNEDYFYVIIPSDSAFTDYQVGDLVSYHITSPDNTWKYYDTIIGCRQALVINGNIADTVKKENSNGAQSTNIPRTAIGVMPNGNVAIFSVESLKYNNANSKLTDVTYGLSLPELADFMRYYGVYNGANFDGGGSTQLISKNPVTNEFEVTVRSSDYGAKPYATQTRLVINTLLVYIKY